MDTFSARSTMSIAFLSALTAFFALTVTANGLTTYTVTEKSDILGSSLNCAADGSGDAGEGNCTLRKATYLANTDGDDSQIVLEAGTYSLTSLYDSTYMTQDIQWGDLDIESDGSLMIEGAGFSETTIDATVVADRIFDIVPGANVTIKNMELTGGFLTADDGGAIKNNGDLLLQNMSLTSNYAFHGGALYMNASTATTTLESTVMDNNTATANGGAIAMRSTGALLEMRNTTIENNAAASGGGIAVEDGEATISESLIYNNTATTSAGGMYINGTAVDVEIQNSTIGENKTAGSGGALYLNSIGSANTVNVISSTIYGNAAGTDGSGDGGAVRAYDSGIDFAHSIIAGNTDSAGADKNCSIGGTSVITSSDYNMESGTDCLLTGTGDITSTDPQLLAIADNGGSTETYAFDLSVGYAALDAVDAIPAADCMYTTDQRSAARPDAGDADCDIGAYEVQDADRDGEESSLYGGADECEEFFGVITPNEYYLDNDHDGSYDQSTVHQLCGGASSDYVLVTDVTGDTDCDDTDSNVYPGNNESPYDGVDNDCDAATPDDDLDGDGYSSTVVGGDDCVDSGVSTTDDGTTIDAAMINVGATETWYDGVDQDCSGGSDFDKDGDGQDSKDEATGGTDCADNGDQTTNKGVVIADEDIFAGASDTWYDNVDQDCSGGSDFDKDLDGEEIANMDFDGDGFAEAGTDCIDDGFVMRTDKKLIPAALINSAATEDWYDGVDQDCGRDNDYDQDHDSFAVTGYDVNGDGVIDATDGTDCDDTDFNVHPSATETWYDGVDQDCSGGSDFDQDGDGIESADKTTDGTDCDDTDATVSFGLYADEDGDGLGDPATPMCSATESVTGYVNNSDDASLNDFDNDGSTTDADCDDANEEVYPGKGEVVYNGINDDCDSATLDDDLDQDGFVKANDANDTNATVYPNAPEIADGVDNDSDGTVDENTDVVDDDRDGVAESQGDCNDANAKITGTTTVFVDGDRDSDGTGTAVVLCVETIPAGFAKNSNDPDDTDPTIHSRFNAANRGTLKSIEAAGNGQVELTYAGGSIFETLFSSKDKTVVKHHTTLGVVFVVSGEGKEIAVLDATTGQVMQTMALPKNSVERGNNAVWVKKVKKGKNGKKQTTVFVGSDNRLVAIAFKTKTHTFGKKSAVTIKGLQLKKPKVKKHRVTVKTVNGKMKLVMTKKGTLKKK